MKNFPLLSLVASLAILAMSSALAGSAPYNRANVPGAGA